MTDKEYTALKAKMKKLSFVWAERLGLSWYRINFEWVRDHAYEKGSDRRDTAGECSASWQYREATVTFYLEKLAAFSDEVIEETIVHELSHVLIAPIQDFSSDNASQMTEFTTTMVAKAVMWAYKDGIKGGKK